MPLIPNAGAVALTGHFSVDPTADLHERSWKGSDERYRVRVPGAVDDGPRTASGRSEHRGHRGAPQLTGLLHGRWSPESVHERFLDLVLGQEGNA